MGEILDDLLTKVDHNGVRSINLALKNTFARLKELQLTLRVRLPEEENSHAKCTARTDASQQTIPNGSFSYEEPSNGKDGVKPKIAR